MTLAALLASICITNGLRYADCVVVEFGADTPPPYLVGIYDAADAQFAAEPQSRSRPLRCRVVNERRACLAVDTRRLPCAVFAQVVPVAWTNHPGFREMTEDDVRARREYAAATAPVSLPDSGDGATWLPRSVVDGCSQEAPIKPMFRSLSASGGRRLGLDWAGRRCWLPASNAVPGRIYWEGLQ